MTDLTGRWRCYKDGDKWVVWDRYTVQRFHSGVEALLWLDTELTRRQLACRIKERQDQLC